MESGRVEFVAAEEALRRERAADPLSEFFVSWDEVDGRDVQRLCQALARAKTERDTQSFLAQHPKLLIQHLGGGHGRWVIPQKRLGAEHVPDFVIGERSSAGRFWTAVELEGPQRPMFTQAGDPSRYLWHVIRQIIDWRVQLEYNRDYTARPPAESGLGLEDISSSVSGLIVIGRRQQLSPRRQPFRHGLQHQLNLQIHSYDWLLDQLRGRVEALERSEGGRGERARG